MNQVNPLHIGALLGVVILFLFFQLSSAKADLKVAKVEYKSSEKVAVDLSSLNRCMPIRKRQKKHLNVYLLSPL